VANWKAVATKLASAHNYWMATTRPDARPHSVPVWGVWLDETFWFATDRASQKGRNLTANPGLVLHLESGDDVVIVEGAAEEVSDTSLITRFADAYDAKYGFRPDASNPSQVVYKLTLRVVLSWQESDFIGTATRWQFDRD